MKKTLLATLCLTGGLAAACSAPEQPVTRTTATPTPAAIVVVTTPTATPALVVAKTENKAHTDGSKIVIKHHTDGSRHEHRTFEKGPLVAVQRQTHADGTVTAHIVHRDDNTETPIKDRPWIEKAMDATGHALATAVGKTKEVGQKVGETVEKDAKAVGGAVKEGAEKVGSEVKKDAKAVGNEAKKVADKTKKAVKENN